MVQRDNTAPLLWEQDYYYSGSIYATAKGIEWEFFTVNYDYATKQASLDYVGTNATIATLMQDLNVAPFGPKDQGGQRTQSHVGSNNQETLMLADMLLGMLNQTRL